MPYLQNLAFEPMTRDHAKEVMDIFNYYIENSFAAYPDTKLPYEFFGRLLEMIGGYPAFVIKKGDIGKIVGFCFLKAHNPLPVFRGTAEVTYFLDKDAVGMGVGKEALSLLEAEAKNRGIKNLLASISSENGQSLNFHKKQGFKECGRLSNIGTKKGKAFDVVWMEKALA